MSSSIMTAFGQIEVHAMPSGKVINVTKAIRFDSKQLVLMDADGKLYCPSVGDKCHFTLAQWRFTDPLIKAMVKLKLITQAQANDHFAAVKTRSERDQAKYDLEKLDELAKQHGIKIPARDRAKLAKKAGISL